MRAVGYGMLPVIFAVVLIGAQQRRPESPSNQQSQTYADLMALDAEQFSHAFARLSPEDKAGFVRARAQLWLQQNRSRLSQSQIALVQEGIDFVSPELYRGPIGPQLEDRLKKLKAKFGCLLKRQDVIDAFSFTGTREPHANAPKQWTWMDGVVAGIEWISNCTSGYIRP